MRQLVSASSGTAGRSACTGLSRSRSPCRVSRELHVHLVLGRRESGARRKLVVHLSAFNKRRFEMMTSSHYRAFQAFRLGI